MNYFASLMDPFRQVLCSALILIHPIPPISTSRFGCIGFFICSLWVLARTIHPLLSLLTRRISGNRFSSILIILCWSFRRIPNWSRTFYSRYHLRMILMSISMILFHCLCLSTESTRIHGLFVEPILIKDVYHIIKISYSICFLLNISDSN